MGPALRDLLYSKERLKEVVSMLDQPATAASILGVVMEIGLPEGAAMVAGYANGDARLLWSMGGGLLGDLYQHKEIAEAAKSLCATVQPLLTHLYSTPNK